MSFVDDTVALMEPITKELGSLDSLGEAAIISIAVSLKRIADSVCGGTEYPSVRHALITIADRMPSFYS